MFDCKDELVDILKDYGYQLVAFPRPNIEPLMILQKISSSNLRKVGHLKELFKRGGSATMPRKGKDIPAPKALEVKKSNKIKINTGLKLVAEFLGSMGVGSLGLDLAYKGANKLIFSYHDILMNEINLIPLDEFINEAVLTTNARTYIESLKRNELYIINSTLKSDNFVTESIDEKDNSVNINLPKIEEIIKGKAKFRKVNNSKSKIQFQGNEPLVFAFQAVQIKYKVEKEGFRLKSADGVILRNKDDFPVNIFKHEYNFLNIEGS